MVLRPVVFGALLSAGVAACAPLPQGPIVLSGSDGKTHDVIDMAHSGRAVVLTFFSPSCPCQAAHDGRLRALAEHYAPLGVEFVSVDSEADASLARDAREALARRYGFPILTDADGRLADRYGADVATYSVVLDGQGMVRFRGGIDSERRDLTDQAVPYLANAIERVLHGPPGTTEERRSLGCVLRRK